MRKLTAVLWAAALIWAVGSGVARAQSAGQVGVFTDSTHLNGAAVTGSGSAVLQTSPTINSPTLTSPALGTPASGVATNLTGTAAGLTAGGNVTGPGSSTTNDCAQFADTTGKVLKDAACPGGGNVSTTGSPTSGQTAQMTGSATITGVANTGTGSYVLATSPTITSPVLVTPALGTPASGVGTNLTGTAAGLTAGVATVANGLKSATTTVAVSSATAPTNGQCLTATSGTTATWQACSGGGSLTLVDQTPTTITPVSQLTFGNGLTLSGSTPNAVLTPTVANRTVTVSPTVLASDMGGVIYSNVSGGGTLTVPAISSTVFPNGSSLQVTNYSASTEAVSTTPTINAGGGCVSGTGIPAGATWSMSGNGTTVDCVQVGVASVTFANPTASTGNTAVNGSATTVMRSDAAPKAGPTALPSPGTSATLVAPRSYYVCTGTCTVTLPTPAAGYEFCVRNDNNVATVITFAAITSVQFENTNYTTYKSANTSIASAGASGDKLCVMGRDATHYLIMSFNGTWS